MAKTKVQVKCYFSPKVAQGCYLRSLVWLKLSLDATSDAEKSIPGGTSEVTFKLSLERSQGEAGFNSAQRFFSLHSYFALLFLFPSSLSGERATGCNQCSLFPPTQVCVFVWKWVSVCRLKLQLQLNLHTHNLSKSQHLQHPHHPVTQWEERAKKYKHTFPAPHHHNLLLLLFYLLYNKNNFYSLTLLAGHLCHLFHLTFCHYFHVSTWAKLCAHTFWQTFAPMKK